MIRFLKFLFIIFTGSDSMFFVFSFRLFRVVKFSELYKPKFI